MCCRDRAVVYNVFNLRFVSSMLHQPSVAFTDLPRVFLGRLPLDAGEEDVASFVKRATGVEIQGCKVMRPRVEAAASKKGTSFARIDATTALEALRIIAYADGEVWGSGTVKARPVLRGVQEVRPWPVATCGAPVLAIQAHVGPAVAANLVAAVGGDPKMLGALAAYPCFLLPYAYTMSIMTVGCGCWGFLSALPQAPFTTESGIGGGVFFEGGKHRAALTASLLATAQVAHSTTLARSPLLPMLSGLPPTAAAVRVTAPETLQCHHVLSCELAEAAGTYVGASNRCNKGHATATPFL